MEIREEKHSWANISARALAGWRNEALGYRRSPWYMESSELGRSQGRGEGDLDSKIAGQWGSWASSSELKLEPTLTKLLELKGSTPEAGVEEAGIGEGSKIHLQFRRPLFHSWVRKIPWRRDGLPTLVFLGFPVAQLVKSPPAMRETWVWSLGREDPLEKWTATHSSILAWRNL